MPARAPTIELRTIISSTPQLEIAFTNLEREMVHFLNHENFINNGVYNEVLRPGSVWTEEQMAGELVRGVRNRVQQDPRSYNTLVNELERYGNRYQPILSQLEAEYARQANLAGAIRLVLHPSFMTASLVPRPYL
jgi:hypothetical protein